ncbi:unnamed protein product [Ilex paraguariensis]|uniref:PWI domain-containing protein n=1 Tax=Ilex paraguariensis TaxID=185542 RepID=A0ABC8SK57_9AQUA
MSGGFFRGTSADQDTRFSNKQAKLLKSQKFAPELDHQVDMTKVKMDVMRPWIAHRVTELLGFEDEVLINFIYGLLDAKKVNGKEVQIALTGFMEKNTGKFMKELWSLLLSAQNNSSGVPQQFLDAKEEETRKKMAETDRIANEIRRKKEKEALELEQENTKKKDGEVDMLRANIAAFEPRSADEKDTSERNGSRGRSRVSKSPHSAGRPLSPRGTHSRSISKSFSNSRSCSKSRSRSGSEPRGRSISSGRMYHSSPRRSVTPRRRHSPRKSLSPPKHRSSNSRRRSTSRSWRRSPSPVRHKFRSPIRRRSRSPMWRSPVRHRSRSPVWRRSRSPVRNRPRSPIRRRSRTPMRRRSVTPVRRRSQTPVRRRSPMPVRRRSPSPARLRYRRSPSTPRRRSPSLHRNRSPVLHRRRSPTPRYRSPSPQEWSSSSPVRCMSPSPIRRSPKLKQRSSMQSPRGTRRTHEKHSPVRRAFPRETGEGSDLFERRPPVSSMSPQRDRRNHNDIHRKVPPLRRSVSKSPSVSESPTAARKGSANEDGRSRSPYKSPVKQTKIQMTRDGSSSPAPRARGREPHHDSAETSAEEKETSYAREDRDQKLKYSGKRPSHSSAAGELKDKLEKVRPKNKYSPERVASHRSDETWGHPEGKELRKQGQETKSGNLPELLHPAVPVPRGSPAIDKDTLKSERDPESYRRGGYKADRKNHSPSKDIKDSDQRQKSETVLNLAKKVENNRRGFMDSGSEESDKHKAQVKEKRKHKRSERQEVASDDDSSSDSQIVERKEAKRRRKEEKRLRKEQRRHRREERHRRREERRAERRKLKLVDTVTLLPDSEKNHDDSTDGEHVKRLKSHASYAEENESEQKRLEIELREKALKKLRAKKGVGH